MNNLDLKEICVQELDTESMAMIEGGNAWRWLALPEFYDAVTDAWEGLKAGFKDGNS